MHQSRLIAYLEALTRNGHHDIVVEESVGIPSNFTQQE
jgi:hypothetical protein